MTTPSANQPVSDPAEDFFATTAGLLPPSLVLKEMGEILVFTTPAHSYSLKANGLPEALPKITGEAIQNLKESAYTIGYDGIIGVSLSHVVDPAARTLTVVAIGTPVKTRRGGPVDV